MKTKYPDSLTIQQYLEGKLDPEVMHQLEKQALDDPFLWDALEGYSTYKDPAADLSILQRQLHERIVHLQENKKVFDLSWQRLSVAAAAAVMFISAGILFWMNSHKPSEQLATHKQVEVNMIDRDSVAAVTSSQNAHVSASKPAAIIQEEGPAVSGYKTGKTAPARQEAIIAGAAKSDDSDVMTSGAATQVSSSKTRVGKVAGQQVTDSQVLNEAGVSVYGAQPKAGWQTYREYLALNARKFITEPALKGSVLLSFDIGATGEPSNIKVVRGLTEAYDKEAIRIVRDGSEWVPLPNGKTTAIMFEVSF